MQIKTLIEPFRKLLADERARERSIGFVPTMGALHQGHLSLIERARKENDIVVVSIFVNPLQFGVHEDLTQYPRPFEQDCELARSAGADIIFAPSVSEMYPNGPVLTAVHVKELTESMEGALRPGHFDGVATVVNKLFAIVGPCRAYFGEKDWQQLRVVKRMAEDLSLPIEVIPCSTVREADGLAMSSRNVYLSAEERLAATALYRALEKGAEEIANGCRVTAEVSAVMMDVMKQEELVEPEYAAIVGPDLEWPDVIAGEVRLLVAARVGMPRLIDNLGVVVA